MARRLPSTVIGADARGFAWTGYVNHMSDDKSDDKSDEQSQDDTEETKDSAEDNTEDNTEDSGEDRDESDSKAEAEDDEDSGDDDSGDDDSGDDSDDSDDDADAEKSGDEKSGKNIYVRDTKSDGRPVVLIHGWPLSSESWSEQIPKLRDEGFRVVAYDRRGFGQSDPGDKYDYDSLADDLDNVLSDLDLNDVTLVGFSMGGGEVARYVSRHGTGRLQSVVFASAVPPYLLKSDDNPDGPLTEEFAGELRSGVEDDRDAFFEEFTKNFFSADDELKVSDEQRQEAVKQCKQSNQEAVLGCMDAWGTTDFREDLESIDIPTLVIHGDSDAIVPFEGSGKRTHETIEGSELVVIEDGPHGVNVSNADEFNSALLEFLKK
jgi:non-heme chloroperoxidase